ncbi:PaaI family thioesterase [Marinobacter confluentis]|uniref:PaaI family thioesterase n=1 Tax=Marinobacter confluentis TaxID=1697557 RepID=A0A4Z1BB02_9GAMM|nr:PaaI family thioesterase [Marinobacter confluentis]
MKRSSMSGLEQMSLLAAGKVPPPSIALMPGESYGTVDLSVKLVRPIPTGVRLRGEGKLMNLSRSVAISQGRIVDDSGKLYAHATCTCMILRPS